MSSYCGDIRLGDTIDIKFTTRQISGAPSTLGGTPVISAYPSNSTTQLTAGITLTVDFDSVTGYNNVRVVASSGNGYATATNYDLCITTGTVNSVSVVGESIGAFSIENRSALMPATAGRTAVVDAAGLIDANAVKVGPTGSGTAQTARDIGASVLLAAGQKVDVDTIKTNPVVNAGTVTFPTGATLASTTNITGGTITTTTNLTNAPTAGDFTATMKTSLNAATPASVTGAVGSVTGNVGGNVTGSVGSVVGAVASVTGNVGGNVVGSVASVVGAVASVAGNVGGNVVGSVASVTGLTASDVAAIKTKTDNLPASPAATSDVPTAATVAAAVWAVVIDGTRSAAQLMRGATAVLLGKASGLATTTAVYRNIADSKDVVSATVDADGNRSAVTLDLT